VRGAVHGDLARHRLVAERVALVGVALQEGDVVDLLVVRAVVLEDVERVQQIVITGKQWTTERGLKIGDSLDRVRELYPELKRFNDLYGKNKFWQYSWALVLEESQVGGPPNVIDRLAAEIRDRKIRSLTVSPYGAGD
jgi:hypothetical protein